MASSKPAQSLDSRVTWPHCQSKNIRLCRKRRSFFNISIGQEIMERNLVLE